MRHTLLLLPLFALGCAGVQEAVRRESAPPECHAPYTIGCADVLDISFTHQPELDGLASVGIDGTVPLGGPGHALVEGTTPESASARIAEIVGIPREQVRVALAAPRSGRVYITGPENKKLRSEPYRGPEPTLAFLERVRAIEPGAADLRDIHVVRPNVASGENAEVYEIEVAACRAGNDLSNVVLRPSDHIYIGESRRSRFVRYLPDWFKPVYRKLVGLLPQAPPPWRELHRDS